MELVNAMNVFIQIIKEAMLNVSWIFTSITIGDLVITPIAIISFTALSVLIPVAIVKWVAS